jgi:PAS domain S-box-containing protein
MSTDVRARAVRAISFPATDAVFAERVREIVRDGRSDAAEVAGTLMRRLRVLHPHVSTSLRSEVAGFGEDAVVYVFRDGSVLPPIDRADWIDDPAVARVVTDATGRYLDANAAAATLFGVTVEQIVGASAGTFTRADTRIEDPAALWRALAKVGSLRSVSIVQCADGSERAVEFVTTRDGDGPGRNVTVLRALT